MDVIRLSAPEHPGGARKGSYSGALAAFALASCASWAYWYGVPLSAELAVLAGLLAALLCVGLPFAVRMPGGAVVDASEAPRALAAVLLGPLWASLVCLPYALAVARRNRTGVLYEVSRNAAGVSVAATAFSAIHGLPLAAGAAAGGPVTAAYAALAAALALVAADVVAALGLLCFVYGRKTAEAWGVVAPGLPPALVGALACSLAVAAFAASGAAAAPALVFGLLAVHLVARRIRDWRAGELRLRERAERLEGAALAAGMVFGAAMLEELGREDGCAHRHAAATAVYSEDIAREMGLDRRRTERLRVAAFLHDIGRFGPSGENSAHPERGARMLEEAGLGELAAWVRYHHERPDGRGYPQGLRGPWIPLESRILAVAEAYAAMVLSGDAGHEAARRELCDGADTRFDAGVVRAFLRVLDTAPESYKTADGPRFAHPPGPRGGSARQVV
ncbi:HD-GYP domain-containing protein [Rubrobacter xylanophilus]|nr:HD domain-containing phosphohydrolase [Rubrobacter xylanophilus]